MNLKNNLSEGKQNYLKTDYIEMWIEEDVFYGKYSNGIIIDKRIAEKVLEDRESICNNTSYLTFWDCRGVKYWTKEARELQSTAKNYRLMKAGACIIKESHVANIIINFFFKINPPPIPSRFFSNKKAALAWLENLK